MKVRTAFPRRITDIENTWIPMADGTRLAARMWLPDDAVGDPVPAILEFIPYRKRDGMARRDSIMHPYFAGHGYAAVRVDLRGSGDSEGLLDDEYCPQEQEDGLDVIRWLAAQPWCSGAVGMIGISWGGFNGLQIAARAPDALKAVISVGSTDDRYADDVHYMGGCLLSANFTWAQTFFADLSRPPDPAIVGERWRDMWLHRLENATVFIERWLKHQSRDAYWRHGSVCEDYAAINCPVFVVGGWADSYTNAVPRLLAGLKVPRLGLIGPWGHDYPHTAVPGPTIGFLAECLRWWDHWLKGRETGIMDEPILRVWMQEAVACDPGLARRPGRWLGLDSWPSSAIAGRVWFLNGPDLSAEPSREREITHASPQTLGSAAGEWCPYGVGADQPADQRHDDANSLCFETEVLDERLEVLGAPVVELRLAVDQREALIAVRLNDVDGDGRSMRVSYGLLNLAHRNGHEQLEPIVPGQTSTVRLALCDTAYAFLPGHRIRVAISTAYWPTVWPSPHRVRLTLIGGASQLFLPILIADGASAKQVRFAPAEGATPEARTTVEPGHVSRRLELDYLTGSETLRVVADDGLQRVDSHGLLIGRRCEESYEIHPSKPLSARIAARWSMTLQRADWSIRTLSAAEMTASEGEFVVTWQMEAWSVGERLWTGAGRVSVPRYWV